MYQPVGVVGIVVPWNYPLFLALGPLAQALAAGNHVMLKMSEYTPEFSALFQKLIAEKYPQSHINVITGDAITLELGGKSPVIVAVDADLKESARRLAFGKTMNAGQTCVAPDYAFVHESQQEAFIQAYFEALRGFYPNSIQQNTDYTAIVNDRQFDRLKHYLSDAKMKGAHILNDDILNDERRMAHSIVTNVSDDMLLMQNEIFGPILPLKTYSHIDEAIAYINAHERPLALYYFGYNKVEQQKVLHATHSGGVCLNETLMTAGMEDMPFGGIGASGMGHYHGHEGFKTFSHAKSVFVRPKFSLMKLIYPPYGTWVQQLIYRLFIR